MNYIKILLLTIVLALVACTKTADYSGTYTRTDVKNGNFIVLEKSDGNKYYYSGNRGGRAPKDKIPAEFKENQLYVQGMPLGTIDPKTNTLYVGNGAAPYKKQ